MMTLEELRAFLNSLPETFNTYGVVNGEVGILEGTGEEGTEPKDGEEGTEPKEDFVYRCDKPIISVYVDENSKEICFFHQTQEDVNKAMGEQEETED